MGVVSVCFYARVCARACVRFVSLVKRIGQYAQYFLFRFGFSLVHQKNITEAPLAHLKLLDTCGAIPYEALYQCSSVTDWATG